MPASPPSPPMPSCMAPSSAISSNIPARGSAFVSPDLEAEIAAHAPKSLERTDRRSAAATYEASLTADPIALVPREPARSRLAVLYFGHDRPAERRDADASQSRGDERRPTRRRSIRWRPAIRSCMRAPMSHGSGLYMMAHVMRAGVQVVPESGGFEPDGDFRPARGTGRALDVRRAHHGQASGRLSRRLSGARISAPSSMAARRCISRMRVRALDRFGPRFAQIYGQGESPMTITHADEAATSPTRAHPRWRERAGFRRPRLRLHARSRVADERGPCLAARARAGEILCRGETGDGRLLAKPGGERAGVARRLLAYRRYRRARRRTAI